MPDSTTLPTAVARGLSGLILLAPAALLAFAAQHYNSGMLVVGAAAAVLGAVLFVRHKAVWRPPASGSVILLYLIGLGWLWFTTRQTPDPFAHFARGCFLVAVIVLLIGHDLTRTGLGPRRRAMKLCRQLANRTRWPMLQAEYHELPEVRALADAVRDDPSPALDLLLDARPEIRLSAFVALQARDYWRPGEVTAVVATIHRTTEASVRAAGVAALHAADQPEAVASVATFLRDPSPDVRDAAGFSLTAGAGRRWPAARTLVRAALTDPLLQSDGALPGVAGRLPPMAVCDLTTWAADAEPLASRSVRTLVAHYAPQLRTGEFPELPAELTRQILDPLTPPHLRVELAGLLRGLGMLPPDVLDRMTDADQPGPLRLLAAETLLAADPTDADAIDVLRGLGRQSHRETSLTVARLVQQYLGVDMGLPSGAIPANSKAGAEVAKKLFQWATGRATASPEIAVHEAGSAWMSRPVMQPALPSLKPVAAPPRTPPPKVLPDPDHESSGNIWSSK